MHKIIYLFHQYETNHVFSIEDGWLLFRIAAIGEAVGWTLLLTGIYLSRYVFHGNGVPILIAGRVHGVLFLMYALASIGLYPTLKWSRKRAFVALLASVPPYGSILFEEWARADYQRQQLLVFRDCTVLTVLQHHAA
jgi:integral membrane protein